jgi:hypothetical protein
MRPPLGTKNAGIHTTKESAAYCKKQPTPQKIRLTGMVEIVVVIK